MKNTFNPTAKVQKFLPSKEQILSVAAKDGIIAIRIMPSDANGLWVSKTVFEIFERYKTPIDMITTSEVAVSLTIDDDSSLDNIVNELNSLGKVEVDFDQTIICIAGNFDRKNWFEQSNLKCTRYNSCKNDFLRRKQV